MWKKGDVLQKGKTIAVIQEVTSEGYDVVIGPALLYSETNWKQDPHMKTWKKIDHIKYPTDNKIKQYINLTKGYKLYSDID